MSITISPPNNSDIGLKPYVTISVALRGLKKPPLRVVFIEGFALIHTDYFVLNKLSKRALKSSIFLHCGK